MPISPILFSIGPLQIRYYGLVYALAFVIFYFFLQKTRDKYALTQDECDSVVLHIVIGLMIGGRLFHFLFSDPQLLLSDPLIFFKIWLGGMSFYGALIGCFTGLLIFWTHHKHTNMWRIADTAGLVASGAIIFGRLANYLNQELVGRITDVPWCVEFTTAVGCRHPYPLYAAFSHLILFIILFVLWKKKPALKPGLLFALFVIGYGVLRFIVDFFRDDPTFLGLTVWQYVSIVTVIIGVWLMTYIKKK